MINLSQQEREKFSLWLDQEADSNEKLVEQMEKMGGAGMEIMIKVKKAEIAACRIIVKTLNVEAMTIG